MSSHSEKPKLTAQVLSDLHQERPYTTYNFMFPKKADYLILAGDIGRVGDLDHNDRFRAWLLIQCQRFKKVFWVLGNNEAKKTSQPEAVRVAAAWADDSMFMGKLVSLDKQSYGYDFNDEGYEVTILGRTLWSQADPGQILSDHAIVGNTMAKHNKRFKENFEWIQEEILATRIRHGNKQRIVVVTHHAPTIKGTNNPDSEADRSVIDKYNKEVPEDAMTWSQYQNDILGGKGIDGLKQGDWWIFGHTHWCCDFLVDNVRVYANQRGRRRDWAFQAKEIEAGRRQSNFFDRDATIEI